MHELSIALSIIEIAEEELTRRGGARVNAVHLTIGPLSGVAPEALLSCYDMASENTSLAGSRLVIEATPVVVYCSQCQARRTLDSIQSFCCPECGTASSEVLQGREMELTAMEIEE